MKIVVLDGYTLNPGDLSWDGIKQHGTCAIHDRTNFAPEAVLDAIGDAEIVFTNKTPLPKQVLENTPSLRYVGVLATGYNVVDVQAARARGIVVTNIPTYGTAAVAQYTMALLLEMCHHVGDHSEEVKKGTWTKGPDFCFWKYPLIELAGKTMGIIGFGRIGQATAKIAQGFGLDILACDRESNPTRESETCKYVSLDELYSQSDIVSLHCPLVEGTEGIINKSSIAKMKSGVMIINTSRGPLVVEQDLADALNSGKVAGAAVDVVSKEPIAADNPLIKAKNCIITPHIAWAPKESRSRLMETAVNNLNAFLSGAPVNVVNG
ncbi:D-2-hydroxyacid dehydrogenase [Novipirellula artificiosorum]|uniref:Glycerate dehydrogenase n=1 Tax=Novipirellula artificiosorum TaxID=2528016 RepID=A0A5C6D8N8_9BACT|nr:D-2-hydroxyacid dehydrogenase [Novipirellula artificiosorum]TWU31219.1 Glycerate dehydrogenase [Novipirellula artificiosorum]